MLGMDDNMSFFILLGVLILKCVGMVFISLVVGMFVDIDR